MTLFDPPLRPSDTQIRNSHQVKHLHQWDAVGLPTAYQTACSCGQWVGREWNFADQAEAEWREHVAEIREAA